MIHINLNMIFYTHVEQSLTETIYIKYARLMAFAHSLALDPTFGIHSLKTLHTAQPCHLLKPN